MIAEGTNLHTFYSGLFGKDLYSIVSGKPLVLVIEEQSQVGEKDIELINKIISAKGLPFESSDITFLPLIEITDVMALAAKPGRFILIFENPDREILNLKKFEVNRDLGSQPVLLSCSLRNLHSDPENKKALWGAMQQL